MQRVRIGLTGLGLVFLLVLLAAAILGLAREEADLNTAPDENATAEENLAAATPNDEPKDPLAELGVAPGGGAADETPETNQAEAKQP